MVRDDTVAVVGAGVIGAAVAYALTREGRAVLLLDRAEPGIAGASFGNAGHIAAELVEPLPSWGLLFGFWRELFAFGGALDIPLRRAPEFLPWALRFAAAARHRTENTRHLAPLVKPAVGQMARWLAEIGRPELLRTNGHFQVWFGPRSDERAAEQGLAMERLGIPTQGPPNEILQVIARRSPGAESLGIICAKRLRAPQVCGFPAPRMCSILSRSFRASPGPHVSEARLSNAPKSAPSSRSRERAVLHTSSKILTVDAVVVCTGAWTASLLEPLGLRVPMESARGYHVEMPGHPALTDTPILYADKRIYAHVRWKDDCALPASWSLPDTTPHPTRENWRDCERALGTWATIALSMARAGLDHDRCFPTIFRASVVSNAPLSSMR